MAKLEYAVSNIKLIKDVDYRLEHEDFNDSIRSKLIDWISPKSEGVDFVAKIMSLDSYRNRRQEQIIVYALMIGLSSGDTDQRDVNRRREYFFINYMTRCLKLDSQNTGLNFLAGFMYFNSPIELISEVEVLISEQRSGIVNLEGLKLFIEKFRHFPPFQYLANLILHAAVFNHHTDISKKADTKDHPLGMKMNNGFYEVVQRAVDIVKRLIYAFIMYVSMDIVSRDSATISKRDRILNSICQAMDGLLTQTNHVSTEYNPDVKLYYQNMQAHILDIIKKSMHTKELTWRFRFDTDLAALRCYDIFASIVDHTDDPVKCMRDFGGTVDVKATVATTSTLTAVDWQGMVVRQEGGQRYACKQLDRPDYDKIEMLAKTRNDIADKTRDLGLKIAQFASNQKAIDAMDFKAVDEEQYLRLLKHNSAALRKGLSSKAKDQSKKSGNSSVLDRVKAANKASESRFNNIIDN